MKKQFLAILFICVTSISWSQIHEVGVFLGGTNYVGDVGRTNYIFPDKIGGGLVYKYNLNPRIALKGNLSLIPLYGDDAQSSNQIRKTRGLNFNNSIKEVAIGIEYNFFEYDMTSANKAYTPYILLEIAGFNYELPQEAKTAYSIPIGLGFKGRLADHIGFAIETRINYTFQDDLDHKINQTPLPLNFEGNSNDWYMFTGISLVYAFGRPSCYTEAR